MVYITKDWPAFKDYARKCRIGTFQMKEVLEGIEVRVRAGRLGFVKTFEVERDGSYKEETEFNEIIAFCDIQGFIKVEGSIQDEVFHW